MGRVHSFPLSQQHRMHFIAKHHLNLTDFPSEKLSMSSICLTSSSVDETNKIDMTNSKYSVILEQQVNEKLARFHSQQFNSLATTSSSLKRHLTGLPISSEPTGNNCLIDGMTSAPLGLFSLRRRQQVTLAPLFNLASARMLATDGKYFIAIMK